LGADGGGADGGAAEVNPGSCDVSFFGPTADGGVGIRTVSRFTVGASDGFGGNVIRTVSFLGMLSSEGDAGGFSSAIIRLIFGISPDSFHVNNHPQFEISTALWRL
jgi:hypothetical protein